MGFRHVHLEGDAKLLINAIQQEEECCASFGGLLEDLKVSDWSNSNLVISFAPKEGNGVVHSLAKLDLSLISKRVWMEDFPNIISNIVTLDFSY